MYKQVLLVTDLGDDTDRVASRVKWILKHSPNCQLTVLHIVEETMIGFGYELIPASALHDNIGNERLQEARIRLAQILSRNDLVAHNVKIQTAVSSHKGILDYCQSHVVELVVIGRHKRTGLLGWLVESTADSILPQLSADLLVVQLDEPKSNA